MPIVLECRCGKRLRVPDEMQGRKVRCPGCKTLLNTDSSAASEPSRPEVATKAKARPRPATKAAAFDEDSSEAPKAKKSSAPLLLLLGCGCLALLLGGGGIAVIAGLIIAARSGLSTQDHVSADKNTGPVAQQTDLNITPLDVDAKGLVPCMMWADETGSAFLALDRSQGALHRFSGPDYKTKQTINLNAQPDWLSASAEGLVLTVASREEIRVLDASTFTVKKTIRAPKLKRAVSAQAQSMAVAWTGTFAAELVVVDLKTEAQTKISGPRKLGTLSYGEEAMMSPDGRSLYTNALSGAIVRWNVTGNLLTPAEIGPRMHSGNPFAITVSADSKYVAQPVGGGNADAGRSYGSVILDANLHRHCVISTDTYPAPLGFDVVNKLIYTGTRDKAGLVTFDLDSGTKKKEYPMFGKGDPRQYLVHPAGNKIIVLQQEAISYLEVKGR